MASGGGTADDYRKVYLQGTRHLIDRFSADPPAKFIYTSSTGVYSQNDGSEIDENSAVEPITETARVLSETENLVLSESRERKFPGIVLRVAGIYGPGRSYWLKKLLNNEARIEGDGDRFLNMIHRNDVVGCIIAALANGLPGEIYNASDDEPVMLREFLTWLAAAAGRELGEGAPDSPMPRKRGLTSKRVSNRKLKRELGYRFRFPTFREGYAAEIQRGSAA